MLCSSSSKLSPDPGCGPGALSKRSRCPDRETRKLELVLDVLKSAYDGSADLAKPIQLGQARRGGRADDRQDRRSAQRAGPVPETRSTQNRMTNLQVVTWPVEKLIPYARNARTHSAEQVAQVAASIAEFGWTNPILAGADGIVIAGHARLLAARKLGMTEVPVIVLDHLTESQRRALVLADNRLALNAGWDEEMLRVEMAALDEGGFNLEVVGFTDDEIEGLLRDPEEVHAGNTDDDAVPETPETAVTVPGDIWLLGEHRLLCGDCHPAGVAWRRSSPAAWPTWCSAIHRTT